MPETAAETEPRRNGVDDAAYTELRDRIVLGKLAAGSRLIEASLGKRIGKNRYAIQAALKRLEHEGLVTRLPGGRARWEVSPLTVEDIREISRVMAALHGLASAMAAELDGGPRAELLAELRDIHSEMQPSGDGHAIDRNRRAELDLLFHRRIIDAAAGPRLTTIVESQQPAVERYLRGYMMFLGTELAVSADEHLAVIDAIERGDPRAAQDAIDEHFINAAERYTKVIEEEGERGTW